MDQFSGPVDEAERRRMGNQRVFVPGEMHRGPLDTLTQQETEAYMKLQRYQKIEETLGAVDNDVLEVEKHIIDLMKKEAGPSNMKMLAEALEITRKLERRNT